MNPNIRLTQKQYRLKHKKLMLKKAKPRVRKQIKRDPTWPNSPGQLKQSRPLIVLKPVRAIRKTIKWIAGWQLGLLEKEPKHKLDAFSLTGVF